MTTIAFQPAVTRLRQGVLAALFSVAFGLALIGGVGFAGADSIHNAAHDSRHSFAFPCH